MIESYNLNKCVLSYSFYHRLPSTRFLVVIQNIHITQSLLHGPTISHFHPEREILSCILSVVKRESGTEGQPRTIRVCCIGFILLLFTYVILWSSFTPTVDVYRSFHVRTSRSRLPYNACSKISIQLSVTHVSFIINY